MHYSLYRRLQCHGKEVCWCVDIVTGDPVTDGKTYSCGNHSRYSFQNVRDPQQLWKYIMSALCRKNET